MASMKTPRSSTWPGKIGGTLLGLILSMSGAAGAATLEVGAGKTCALPFAAVARDGDHIMIASGL